MSTDLLDKKIMYELDKDARISATEIGKLYRVSKETVNYRIKKLQEEGYLKGFYAVFDITKLRHFYYKGFIKYHNTTPTIEKELLDFIANYPKCAWLGGCEGRYDLIFLMMVRDAGDFKQFQIELMSRFGDYILEKEICRIIGAYRLNEKFLYPGETFIVKFDQTKITDTKIDDIDMEIMKILGTEARISLVELGKKINQDPKVIKYRMKRLEDEKVTGMYTSAPNFDKLGLEFLQLNFCVKDLNEIQNMINYFDATNKCLYAVELIGKYDLTIEIHVENDKVLRKIIDGFKEKFVNKYYSYDVFPVYKEYVVNWLPFIK